MIVAIVEIFNGDIIVLHDDEAWTGDTQDGKMCAQLGNWTEREGHEVYWPESRARAVARGIAAKVLWVRPFKQDNLPPDTIY